MKIQFKRSNLVLAAVIAAALMAGPAAQMPEAHASAAAAKYKITNQAFRIEGTSKTIGTLNSSSTTYIALRSLGTNLGLNVSYDSAAKTVKITGRGRVLTMNLNNGSTTLNGQLIFGPEAIVQDNVTYLPLRFLLEQMGYVITYDQTSKLIGIQAIQENDLQVETKQIGADGDGKSLSVYYPVISGYKDAVIQQKINNFIKQEVDKQIESDTQIMDNVIEENNELIKNDPDISVNPPSLDAVYKVSYNEKGLLSLYLDYYLYLGGAHGDTIRTPYTFDLTTGNVLSLKEAAGNKAEYVTIINNEIQKQIKSRNLSLLTPFKTIESDRDYFLNHNGIVIYFDEYEYTPFALGLPEFTIPYSKFE
ncbi:PdaC/SigV domain-containing protein [Paenibacillus pinistramenti]|uniref:PdaC/SigV domain-containing protein n=1 Tax=Paenibacillus pinistramenti TaxID=1768003 RepID=UPI0013969CFD|nr:DUF4163 domain-containing protein [Paenibacillus pinistramenti]